MNLAMLHAIERLENVTIHDLYEDYPNGFIDVAREKAALLEHDIIVWQHPFFWYSSPALLKEWQDLVLTYGFAYGEGGTALQGKRALSAITTGGGAESYRTEGQNHFTIREFLAPFQQTAQLCGMTYLEPFVIHDSLALSPEEINSAADRYRQTILKLRDSEA